jgi:PAS domain S-box-containing protein
MANDPNSHHQKPEPTVMKVDSVPSGLVAGMGDSDHIRQMAFDASPDMIAILDTEHRIIAVNPAMAKAMGCSPEQARGHRCYNLFHKSNGPSLACPHLALIEDGKTHQSEIYEERLDTWMLVTVKPLYNRDKVLAGSIHIARDITRQKRSEQAYRESEERYRHLSEATIDGVLLSEDSTIIAANQVLADMMAYNIKDLIGMNLLMLVTPHDRSRLIQSLRSRSAGIQAFECVRKDGTVFPIETHSRAVAYKGGMVYQTAIRDLTEQKRIEQERAQRERLQGALEMAGAVCHEINQPLMALQGFMELLASKIELSDKASHSLHRMENQIERIKKLTHKLMHITKYETKDYAGGDKIIDIHQAAPEDENACGDHR